MYITCISLVNSDSFSPIVITLKLKKFWCQLYFGIGQFIKYDDPSKIVIRQKGH